jgi:hypothetical protein
MIPQPLKQIHKKCSEVEYFQDQITILVHVYGIKKQII